VSCGQLQRPLEDRERGGNGVEGQERLEGVEVDLASPQGLQLGSEGKQPVLGAVVERLDPEAVPGEHKRALPRVPEREREHTPQLSDELRAVLLVEVDEHFGVALGGEPMAAPLETVPELAVVVDLAVLDDMDRPVFVSDWLIAAFEIDDGKAPRGERHGPVDDAPFAVWATVTEGLAHRRERSRVDPGPVEGDQPADPAHGRGV
jgi:hypothetical protein